MFFFKREHVFFFQKNTTCLTPPSVPRVGRINEFDIVGGEETEVPAGPHPLPPAFVYLLDVGNYFRGVEGYFRIIAGLVVVQGPGTQTMLG